MPVEFGGYEEARTWKRRQHRKPLDALRRDLLQGTCGAWDGAGPGMTEVLVERLRAAGVAIDDLERWTVEAADDIGDGADVEPGPPTLEVDALDRRGAPPASRAPAADGSAGCRRIATHRRSRAAAL